MLFLQLVSELAEKYNIRLVCETAAPDLRDVELLDGLQSAFDEDVLYIGYARQLGECGAYPLQCIVVDDGVHAAPSKVRCVATVSEEELFPVFNLAQKNVDDSTGRGLYEDLCALADKVRDVSGVLDAAASKLGNSLIFNDCEFRVIASSNSIPVVDPIWSKVIQQGYCTYEYVEGMMALDSVKKASYTTDAFEVSCTESPYRKLTSKVLVNGAQVGFVLMVANSTPVTLAHFQMLKTVSAVLSYIVQNYANYLFERIDPYQQLLYNLLIGASPQNLSQQISALEFPSKMVAFCIRQTRFLGHRYMKEEICRQIARLMPEAHTSYYEGSVAGVLPMDERALYAPDFRNPMLDFAKRQHVRIGVSYPFENIGSFAQRYQQASAALDVSQKLEPDNNVALYREYQLFHLFSRLPGDTNLGQYCHPALSQLRRYDHENNSELYKTLRCFVDTGGRKNETADMLYIHRNSLSYRLDHIRELTRLDITDPSVLFFLKLSFCIDRYDGLDS